MKRKKVLSGVFDAMIGSYAGTKFWPSLILRLVMALASAVITAVFADTLFSQNNIRNQIYAALFFYFLLLSVSKLIAEIRRGGIGGRLKKTLGDMVRLKPPGLWFFLAAAAVALVLPYALVLSLALLLACSAMSAENSVLLSIKNAVVKSKAPEKNGRGLAAAASGLLACGLVICLLANLGVPTLYGVIDGKGRPDSAQTGQNDPSSTPSPMPTPSASDGGEEPGGTGGNTSADGGVIVSGDTHPAEAARLLTDKLIGYAGSDRKALAGLFRDTDDETIDQYYDTSFAAFKAYDKCLIAIAAQDENSVWFTALYYRIPDGYPAEREDTVYLSTIMTRGSDGWKLTWNEDVRTRLSADYTDAGSTYAGREAREAGRAWAKFFIPFDLYGAMLYYDDAVLCKPVEMFVDEEGNIQITLYASNATGKDLGLAGVDITVSDGGEALFSRHFSSDWLLQNGNATTFTFTIPAAEAGFDTWSRPTIDAFTFTCRDLGY